MYLFCLYYKWVWTKKGAQCYSRRMHLLFPGAVQVLAVCLLVLVPDRFSTMVSSVTKHGKNPHYVFANFHAGFGLLCSAYCLFLIIMTENQIWGPLCDLTLLPESCFTQEWRKCCSTSFDYTQFTMIPVDASKGVETAGRFEGICWCFILFSFMLQRVCGLLGLFMLIPLSCGLPPNFPEPGLG